MPPHVPGRDSKNMRVHGYQSVLGAFVCIVWGHYVISLAGGIPQWETSFVRVWNERSVTAGRNHSDYHHHHHEGTCLLIKSCTIYGDTSGDEVLPTADVLPNDVFSPELGYVVPKGSLPSCPCRQSFGLSTHIGRSAAKEGAIAHFIQFLHKSCLLGCGTAPSIAIPPA